MRRQFALLLFVVLLSVPVVSQERGHSINGFVRDEGTQAAISSASVEITMSGSRAAPSHQSGMNGEFTINGLRDGDYYISVTKEDYEPATVQVSLGMTSITGLVISLHKKDVPKPAASSDAVSARELAIPRKAHDAFEKGRKSLYERAEPEKALGEFQRALEIYPSYYGAEAQIGVANYRLGKVPAAEQALRKSLDQSSNKYLEGLFLLAQLLNDQQRFADAEPCARQAIVVDEASWHGHFELARSLVGLKRGPEAEASAIRARDLKPDNPQVFLVLANVHLQGRDYPAVVQDFNAYLKLDPSSPASEGIRNRRDQLQKAIQNAQAQSVKP